MTKKTVTPKREQMYVISDGSDDWKAFNTLDELNYWLDVECMDTDVEGFLVEIVKPLSIKLRAQVEE